MIPLGKSNRSPHQSIGTAPSRWTDTGPIQGLAPASGLAIKPLSLPAMMGVPYARSMAFLPRSLRPHGLRRLTGLLLLLASYGSLAARAGAPPEIPYPSNDTLRKVQLGAVACARENTAASCSQAKALADPLIDHPQLPSGCKDLLWTITYRAKPADRNTYQRRDGLEQPAEAVVRSCQYREPPTPASKGGSKPAAKDGGFKFGN